jgi:hypothetical protein
MFDFNGGARAVRSFDATFEDALCFDVIQGKPNCAQALNVEAWIRGMWERLSVGEITIKAEVVLFHDAFKVGLASCISA